MRDGASVVSGGSSKARSKASRKSKSSKASRQAPTIEAFMLEVYGEDFKEAMIPLLRDNSAGLTKAPNSFRGDEAVEVLLEIIKNHSDDEDEEVKPAFAIQVGRALSTNLKLFVNTSHEKKQLEANKKEFYVFKNNLPIQVHKAKENYPSLWDRVKLLETHLEVKDRKTLLQTHADCFVAKEAVDILMDSNLAVSREESVTLLNRMNEKVKFCKHATNSKTEFSDKKDLYFRFTPASVRTPQP